jgi:hypothetical protein
VGAVGRCPGVGGLGFRYYELPVVGAFGAVRRAQLDFWMRQGIPDATDRARTLMLYVDIDQFCAALGIATRETIALMLVDADGRVMWHGFGPFDPRTARQIVAAAAERGIDLEV